MRRSKGFTLIELIVVISIVAILVGLSTGLYKGYTKEAHKAEWKNNIKVLEQASEQYYMKTGNWPRKGDVEEYFTSEEIGTFAEKIKDLTGENIELDPSGKYYGIDYLSLAKYVQIPKNKENYILQNPVGKVMYLDNLTEAGKEKLSNYKKLEDAQKAPIRQPEEGEIEIRTPEDLNNTRNNSAGKYILMSDIDLIEYTNWSPITNFTGEIDGNGYTIKNINIDRPYVDNIGLIGSTGTSSIILNVKLTNIHITGRYTVGGLVGTNAGVIRNSYSEGDVVGAAYIGGLVGSNTGGITKSYSKCGILGGGHAGGLVGINQGTISNTYATGNVQGDSTVGGLAGRNNNGGNITNSYSKGYVTGTSSVGGFTGQNNLRGVVTNSYWDILTSGVETSAAGIGKQSEDMYKQSTYTNWDFETIWQIQEGQSYPTLQWQN